ncbi:MAG: methionine adenosyltransferase [Paludibacteraceae bacterium]|nr:methionine adenosyltransferase [Paludibacteraceae bacterium]MBR6492947.1 methionine adenosyltransferase [Paludibacteraceae bacterium]
MKNYLFTSESVSEGHPDKVSDQISDAILDNMIAQDPQAHVACETLCTTGQVVIAGEVSCNGWVDIQKVVRKTIAEIGYTKAEYKFEAESCGILTALHAQSQDINMGVNRAVAEEQGAGDQGMMFGYATDETDNYMPLTLDLAHTLVYTLARIRKEGKQMTYLRPDSKSQVTIEYDEHNKPVRIDTIVLSTQHDEGVTPVLIKKDIIDILLPRVATRDSRYSHLLHAFLEDPQAKLLVNPTGNFVIGGPHGDTGLTGRKIIVDTYGGRGAHGGGAFSGKDPSKVDRSAAYAARWIAKHLVAAGVAHEALVQVSYAIGVAEPVSLYVNTYGTAQVQMSDAEIADKVAKLFDLRPAAIIRDLKLTQPMYEETAKYGHVGRTNEVVTKEFIDSNGNTYTREVELFTWEKLNRLNEVKAAFGL